MKIRTAKIIVFNLLIVGLSYYWGYQYYFVDDIPAYYNIIKFDAVYFESIKDTGYQYVPFKTGNLAFFPLFPYFWKLTGLSAIGISIVNAIIFLLALMFLLARKNLTIGFILLLVSLPSAIFFFLPYTEALFFAFGVIIILNADRDNKYLVALGFLGCSLVKSVSLIFIPAIILTELLFDRERKPIEKLKRAGLYISASLAGLFISACVQAYQTGKWFYFITIQKYWFRHWLIPKFPLTTFREEVILAIDGAAFTLGILAGIYCIFWILWSVFNKTAYDKLFGNVSWAVHFSALFIAATTLLDVIFTYDLHGNTSIWSLNRHVFCTPFAIRFIMWLVAEHKAPKQELAILLFVIVCGVFVTGVFKYPLTWAYYLSFFSALAIIKYLPERWYLSYPAYAFNVYLFITFYSDFLSGLWVA